MKTDRYLICYDISDQKRLAKLARTLDKIAYRIQYSIYLLENASKSEVLALADEIMEIIDEKADDVRIYRIKNSGLRAGCAVDLDNPYMWTEK